MNVNIGTRENKLRMFSYILSCKIRPREFIDQFFFYAGYEKSEIRKETRKDFRVLVLPHRRTKAIYFSANFLCRKPALSK